MKATKECPEFITRTRIRALEHGRYPAERKTARLVLLKKDSRAYK